jgi:hypothetical protein
MERLVEALTGLVQRGFAGQTTRDRCDVRVDAAGAPACVQALVEAMATSVYSVDLGAFHMRSSRAVKTLSAELASAQEGAEVDTLPVEPATTLLLTADRGGMSALGLAWGDGKVSAVIVELEEPTPENLVRIFATPAELLAALDGIDHEAGADIEALRAAVS